MGSSLAANHPVFIDSLPLIVMAVATAILIAGTCRASRMNHRRLGKRRNFWTRNPLELVSYNRREWAVHLTSVGAFVALAIIAIRLECACG
ncbi:hypothetical protein [Lysobacter gummosus]|jgi:hypothetical protein|uniref:Transmembrane protein n=1 Tax=Lysobacter gummosus TaxID=262324 RepID=A0ABY3XHG5_9GAMM|nr:hypothetical protein [Lysobacter gummosus]ALN90573.1 hypothetical protein LG3211_1597 [Lysobacter gummosus]UNP31071.1 hypothetical protein MOV92_07440 [Lysobacter gummosus]